MGFELGYESFKVDRVCFDGRSCFKASDVCDKCLIRCSGIDLDYNF